MDDNTLLIVILVSGALLALMAALAAAVFVFRGAVLLLAFAGAQGFIGLAAYVAAWVFLFPVMLVASFGFGLFIWYIERQSALDALQHKTPRVGHAKERLMARFSRSRNDPAPNQPPADPAERIKWANRLPPYDD